MAYFAKLGVGNVVKTVLVVDDSIATSEQAGSDFLNTLFQTSDVWKQTYTDGTRQVFAGIGYTYDMMTDVYVVPAIPVRSNALKVEDVSGRESDPEFR
jgi:hypothetical protein